MFRSPSIQDVTESTDNDIFTVKEGAGKVLVIDGHITMLSH
jgi:hypothetical protein